MYFNTFAFSAIYAVVLSNIVLFSSCKTDHQYPAIMNMPDDANLLDPASMNMANDANLLDRISIVSQGDYLYTTDVRDILQGGKQIFNISWACIADIEQVIRDIISNPPKLYAAQSKWFYILYPNMVCIT